jgi:hypothetical protein
MKGTSMNVLGTELLEGTDLWYNLGNAPTVGLYRRWERTGECHWTNISGISRDVMMLFYREAGRSMADLYRINVPGTSQPDLYWTTEFEDVIDSVRTQGSVMKLSSFTARGLGQGYYSRVTMEESGDWETGLTLSGTRTYMRPYMIENRSDPDDDWRTQVVLEEPYIYHISRVGVDYENKWVECQAKATLGAIAEAKRYLGTRNAQVYGITTIEQRLSRYALRCALHFKLL